MRFSGGALLVSCGVLLLSSACSDATRAERVPSRWLTGAAAAGGSGVSEVERHYVRIAMQFDAAGVELSDYEQRRVVEVVLESEDDLIFALGLRDQGLALGQDVVRDSVRRYELRVRRVVGVEQAERLLHVGLGLFVTPQGGQRAASMKGW
jgi:hypothetical protein